MILQKIPVACLLLLTLSIGAMAHTPWKPLANDNLPLHDSTLSLPDREAQFPGGPNAWAYYLQIKLRADVPANNNAPVGIYKVIVQFVINKDGLGSGITPITHHGYGMEAELIRIIQNGPRWIPARQKGRNINAYRRQPVTFAVR